MRFFFTMAWRNLWRNKRRSAITIGALAFSVVLLVFFLGFLSSWATQMEGSVTGLTVGHLQIHHPQYRADQNLHQLVDDVPALLARLEEAGFAAAPRWYGYGLLASDRTGKSAGVRIEGISLELEPRVTRIAAAENLLEGRFLTGAVHERLPEATAGDAEPPELTDPIADPLAGLGDAGAEAAAPEPLLVGEVVLGKKLAANLDAHVGDTVAVVTMAADGSMGNELFDVVGIFENLDEAADRSLALVSQADYERLFHIAAHRAHEIALRSPEGLELAAARERAAALAGDTLETATWREIQPAQAQVVDLQQNLSWFFTVVFYAGAGLLIMNSMLMMVFERIHEFGVMKAVGLRGKLLLGLVYFETFWMCVVAAVVGLGIGVPLTLWIGSVGIDLSRFAPDGFALSGAVLDPVMYADVTAESVVLPLAALFLIAFLSVLYPAAKAAVIEPVKAIYHV